MFLIISFLLFSSNRYFSLICYLSTLVVLFNNRDSGRATLATAVRIALTLAASALFIPLGLTGAMWALAATTAPCLVEFALTHLFARRYVREIPDGDAAPCGTRLQFRFTLPLSLGGFLLAAAPSVIAAFVNRTPNGVSMLAVHYATIGLANPVAYGALRMQALALQFPPEYAGKEDFYPNQHTEAELRHGNIGALKRTRKVTTYAG